MFVIFTILILQGRGAENIARAELENGDLRFGLEMVIAMGIVAIIESTTVSHDRHADVAKKGFSGYFCIVSGKTLLPKLFSELSLFLV